MFFRANDPEGPSRWYAEHLGVTPPPTGAGTKPWDQAAGPTVFSPFPADTGYFEDPHHAWMVNFRVADLDVFVGPLRSAGIDVTVDPEPYPIGRFARLHDPEGNPIERWQPGDPRAPL